ncbi:hypothetical protein MTR67_022851 [Solanum verrucosum]|uniref:Uncharacterized protein n=1 Tax=Solanum verrucosum TaxID=315347 RepID=A0AAF0TRA5_SOLVR|nr:hypothetical protein MTR67_022851 [Solanum verrucosum]
MAIPKVPAINQPPRKRARGIVINEGAALSRSTQVKLPPTVGKNTSKGKGHVEPSPAETSFDSMGIYVTHLTTSESDNEGNSGTRSPIFVFEQKDDQTLQLKRAELCSKALHDSARIHVPPPPPAQTVEQFHKFEIYTWPRGSYIPSWVREFHVEYGKLVPKGNKKANLFAPVDHIVVQGRRVKCIINDINEMLGSKHNPPTKAGKPSSTPGTSTIVPSTSVVTPPCTIAASRPPLTQDMLFKMGYLA